MARLDCSRFVVLGEGLAAGMTNFSLIEVDQLESFPAQMARQMKVDFPQPLFQAPGLGDAPGFPRLPVRLPFDHQTTVLRQLPPAAPYANLSLPGMTLADALTRRPAPPVVRGDDALQTAVNLVLGMDGPLTAPAAARPTLLEYALARKPTLALVELGYAEVLAAAADGRAEQMPDPAVFRTQYAQLVQALRAIECVVVVTTIPDPVDTAYFSPLESAARVLKVPAATLASSYGLAPGDRVSVEALTEMGYQLICKAIQPLPEHLFLREAAAAAVSARVLALNAEIAAVARELGAVVYDLHALFGRVRTSGLPVRRKLGPVFELGAAPTVAAEERKYLVRVVASSARDLVGREFPVSGVVTVGRGEGCEIRLSDPNISRKHARLGPADATSCAVADVGSANGTWLDDKKVGEARVPFGRRFRVGDTQLVCLEPVADDSAEAATVVIADLARLKAHFLGGFYSLNGYYPGQTGQALIANELLAVLNTTFGTEFESLDAAKALAADPVAAYRLAEGPDFTPEQLAPAAEAGATTPPPPPAAAAPSASWSKEPKLPLTLPPNLEQVLPLSKEASYYGDALRPVHTTDPQEVVYGLSGNLLFGGLALLDSHLSGNIHVTFTPPEGNLTHFYVTHDKGLLGDNGRLSAPQFFKLPGLMNRLFDSSDVFSEGDLDLATGKVTNLSYHIHFLNSAIFALAKVNPALPTNEPMHFPGQYGSAWARFQQRADGLLDFEFYGTTFIPMSVLNAPARFPLPFASPTMSYASIPCDGTALHPHIHLSTVPPEPAERAAEVPELPENAVQVFTASSYNNYFGDDFSLNAKELGGPASGRSHLVGRYQIQFGARSGNTVTVAVTTLMPGGLLTTLPQSPIAGAFGKRVPDSLLGHDEWLRFRKQTYYNDNISWLDDPLDIAVGAVDLQTGKLIGHLLRRGMINTNWILAMLRLEPRTPKSTFEFRGPASFVKGANGETVFRYYGDLHIPFPEGFFFPAADMVTPITIGPNSALDPYLRFQGTYVPKKPALSWSGGSRQMTASNCVDFSYRYSITNGPGESSFELEDITGGGRFQMTRLTWVDMLNSRGSVAPPGEFDTLSFTGLGTWSEDAAGGLHTAAVQVSTSPGHPYVTILIDGGYTRNLNTRPPNRDIILP